MSWLYIPTTEAGLGDMLKATYDTGADGKIDPAAGGTGITTAASTGVPTIASGVWSVVAQLTAALGGTAIDTSGSTGVASVASGTWSILSALTAALGGTGISTASSTGVPSISSGTWSVNATLPASLGGTGVDLSGSTGAVIVDAGVVSAAAQLAVGKGGTALSAVSDDGMVMKSTGSAFAMEEDTKAIVFEFGDGVTVPTALAQCMLRVPFACTIQEATILGTPSGSAVIDIWKLAYSTSALPTNTNTITASATPTLSSDVANTDTTLTGWTTAIAAGDVLIANLDSIATCALVNVTLKVKRT